MSSLFSAGLPVALMSRLVTTPVAGVSTSAVTRLLNTQVNVFKVEQLLLLSYTVIQLIIIIILILVIN